MRAVAGALLAGLMLTGVLAACGQGRETGTGAEGAGRAPDAALGRQVYAARCAACHGEDLQGTDKGPSQLSEVYEPGHHPDESYRTAIRSGSRQHHWRFGDMPAVPGLSEDEVAAVIGYIRSVQQERGFEPYRR